MESSGASVELSWAILEPSWSDWLTQYVLFCLMSVCQGNWGAPCRSIEQRLMLAKRFAGCLNGVLLSLCWCILFLLFDFLLRFVWFVLDCACGCHVAGFLPLPSVGWLAGWLACAMWACFLNQNAHANERVLLQQVSSRMEGRTCTKIRPRKSAL